MKVKIRKANGDDVKLMQKFMYLLMKEEYENFDPTNKITWAKSKKCADYFKMRVSERGNFALIAEVDDEPVGYLSGGIYKSPEFRTFTKLGQLGDMFIIDGFRNQKIGTKLIREFKKWLKQRGAKRMRVELFTKNKKALRFYARHGFEDYTSILEGKI
jgi:GNAT superfamily N-acetyltransferase